jgi:uncharacterized membrane protein YbhN (UPF0104 family)
MIIGKFFFALSYSCYLLYNWDGCSQSKGRFSPGRVKLQLAENKCE